MAEEGLIRVCVLEGQFVELTDAGASSLLNVLAHAAARPSIGANTVVHENSVCVLRPESNAFKKFMNTACVLRPESVVFAH